MWAPRTSANASGFLLPTLLTHSNYNRKGVSKNSGDGLMTVLQKLPTLTVQDAKNNGGPSQALRDTPPLNALIGGPLNPEWAEWFMGWPIGWTASEPLAMAGFRQWLRQQCAGFQD